MPAIFDLQGRFVFACEIFTHHNTMLQCNYPTFSWITVNRTEAGDWERVWFVPTPDTAAHQGYYFYSHFGNWLKLSGYSSPDPVFDSTTSTAVTPPTDALPIYFDPLPERGPNWYGFRFWNGSESRYFQAQPSTADTPLADTTAVSDWEGFQVRTLAITVRANTAAVMQATSATTVGTYTGSVTDTERWEVEQCPYARTNVYLKSRYYGSYVTFASGTIILAEKSAGSTLVVEKKSGTTTNQVTLKFLINNQYLSAPSTGGLTYSATAGTDQSFDIIYA